MKYTDRKTGLLCILVLLTALWICCAASGAAAESGSIGSNLTWTLDDQGVLTISGTGEMAYNNDFLRSSRVKKVIINQGVTSISDGAFDGCTLLTSVSLPGSLKSIGAYAFMECSTLPGIQFPGSLKSIGNYAFEYCSALSGVTLPGSLTSLGEGAFAYCVNLTSITIPGGVTSIPHFTFFSCSSLSSVSLPSSLTGIGSDAFQACGLLEIDLPAGLRSIGENAFNPGVIIHAKESSYAAQWAKEHGYSLITEAGRYYRIVISTHGQGTASAVPATGLPGTVVTLSATPGTGYSFDHWDVSSTNQDHTLSGNTLTIGTGIVNVTAHFSAKVAEVPVSGGVYRLNYASGTAVFKGLKKKNNTKLTIQATIKYDGETFRVTEIAANACKGNKKLKQVTIGANIETIGANAFNGCSSLTKVTIKTTKLTKAGIGRNCFKGTGEGVTYKCQKKMKKNYKAWLTKVGKASKKASYK